MTVVLNGKEEQKSSWDKYKGAFAAATLSLLTASLFVLRSKEPSSSCNEVVLWWSEVLWWSDYCWCHHEVLLWW